MNITFICQAGIIEAQATLLAISLRKHKLNCNLTACIPNQFGPINTTTESILQSLNVNLVNIQNNFNPIYPIGNKVFVAQFTENHDLTLFLDSDLICIKNFDLKKPTVITNGKYNVITHYEWKNVFNFFGLALPPIFESLRSPFVCANSFFFRTWKENAIRLWDAYNSKKLFLRSPRNIDQISLTITVIQDSNFEILKWRDNEFLQSPSELYIFNNDGEIQKKEWPALIVLQKGWLYYERQGSPQQKSPNPNSLAYYPEIRSLIYNCLNDYPNLDRIPSWENLYKFYFSQNPMN